MVKRRMENEMKRPKCGQTEKTKSGFHRWMNQNDSNKLLKNNINKVVSKLYSFVLRVIFSRSLSTVSNAPLIIFVFFIFTKSFESNISFEDLHPGFKWCPSFSSFQKFRFFKFCYFTTVNRNTIIVSTFFYAHYI